MNERIESEKMTGGNQDKEPCRKAVRHGSKLKAYLERIILATSDLPPADSRLR